MPNVEKFLVEYEPPRLLNCYDNDCKFFGESAQELFKHYNSCHKTDKNFISSCLHSKKCFHVCPFKSLGALSCHLRTYHKSFFTVRDLGHLETNGGGLNSKESYSACSNYVDRSSIDISGTFMSIFYFHLIQLLIQ